MSEPWEDFAEEEGGVAIEEATPPWVDFQPPEQQTRRESLVQAMEESKPGVGEQALEAAPGALESGINWFRENLERTVNAPVVLGKLVAPKIFPPNMELPIEFGKVPFTLREQQEVVPPTREGILARGRIFDRALEAARFSGGPGAAGLQIEPPPTSAPQAFPPETLEQTETRQLETGAKIVGAELAAHDLMRFFATPEGIATAVAAPYQLARALIAAGFSGEMASQVQEAARQAGEMDATATTPEEKAQAMRSKFSLFANIIFPGLIAGGAVKAGNIRPPRVGPIPMPEAEAGMRREIDYPKALAEVRAQAEQGAELADARETLANQIAEAKASEASGKPLSENSIRIMAESLATAMGARLTRQKPKPKGGPSAIQRQGQEILRNVPSQPGESAGEVPRQGVPRPVRGGGPPEAGAAGNVPRPTPTGPAGGPVAAPPLAGDHYTIAALGLKRLGVSPGNADALLRGAKDVAEVVSEKNQVEATAILEKFDAAEQKIVEGKPLEEPPAPAAAPVKAEEATPTAEAVTPPTSPVAGEPTSPIGASAQIAQVSGLTGTQFNEWARQQTGGFTTTADKLGDSISTPEELAVLKAAWDNARKRGEEAQAGPLNTDAQIEEAQGIGYQEQFFSEAYGRATGTGSAGEHAAKTVPGYKPKFQAEPETPTPEPSPAAAGPEAKFLDIPESQWTPEKLRELIGRGNRKAILSAVNSRLGLKGIHQVSAITTEPTLLKRIREVLEQMRKEKLKIEEPAPPPAPISPPAETAPEGELAPAPIPEPPKPAPEPVASTQPAPVSGATKAPKRVKVPTEKPWDLISQIEGEYGKIDPKLIREADPNWKPVGAVRRILRSGGTAADVVATRMAEQGLYKGDPAQVDQLGYALNEAAKGRIGFRKGLTKESKLIQEGEQQASAFGKTVIRGDVPKSEKPNLETVSVGELVEGDKFKALGQDFVVEKLEIDEDGNLIYVTVKDGPKFGVQVVEGDEVIHIDKNSLKTKPVEFLTQEEEAKATPPTPVAPSPQPSIPKLSAAEQKRLALAAKDIRDRIAFGEEVTLEERERLRKIESESGQAELIQGTEGIGVKERAAELRRKADEMDRLRLATEERAWSSKFQREELLKEAKQYQQEADKARADANYLEGKRKPKTEGGDLFTPSAPGGIRIKTGGGETAALLIPQQLPVTVERVLQTINRNRKAFGTLFRGRANRRVMDQTFDAADNMAKIVGQQAARSLQLRGNAADRAAAMVIIEAQGDAGRLIDFARQASGNREALSAVRWAEDNWDRLQPLAQETKRLLDRQIHDEEAAGIDTEYREGYVPHIIDRDLLMGSGRPFIIAGRGTGISTGFKKGRVFETIFDAIEAGYHPRTMDVADLVEHRIGVGQRLINRKAWADGLRDFTDPTDQKPLVTDLQRRQRGPAGKFYEVAPQGYSPREIIPGVRIAVHEGYGSLFDALTGTSRISGSVPGRVLLGIAGGIKHVLLAFDTFHASRIGQKEAFLTGKVSYGKGQSLLEYADRDLNEAVRQNIIPQEIADWVRQNRPVAQRLIRNGLNVGRIQEGLYADWVNKIPGIGPFKTWVFDKLTRGAILESGLIEFERVSRANPRMTPDEVARKVSRDLNVYFGNLGRQGVFKSATMLDLSRLAFLAPQWVESMVRTEAKGFAQAAKGLTYDPVVHKTLMVGSLGKGVAQGLIAYVVGTQILNLFTRGQFTFQNKEPGHKLDAWIPDWSGEGKGFFLSPLSVVAEVSHDLLRYSKTEPSVLAAAARIAANKASPMTRAGQVLLSGRTFSGEKLVDTWDRVKAAGWALAPTPIPLSPTIKGTEYPGQVQRQLTASLGVKTEPAPSRQATIRKLADDWLAQQKDPKLQHEYERQRQQEFGPSDYSRLRNALYANDLKGARLEYDRLLPIKGAKQIRETMNYRTAEGMTKPLLNNRRLESGFLRSLKPEQRELYREAMRERAELYRRFGQMLRETPGPGK